MQAGRSHLVEVYRVRGCELSACEEIINLTENLDCYEVYPDIHDYDDLGRYYIEELDVMQVPEHLQNYIDYEAYGRDVALEENGTFTDQGYVRDTGDSFHEYYDGERGSIPDEYRVMTFQDDLPEEEKSEWAMDIAFDMDEFFRQNDPQYAAEHPEAHAAKEELYENLMAGRISALDEKLAALGQTQEDYLPSEIEKFKDATGYEEFLDFDPAEVKAALENPDKSRIDEMLAFAEKAEREYAAEIAAYVQTPADIAEQAQAVPRDTFSIYQLKPGDATRDYRFEPLDAIRNNGLSVKPENYELVYTAPLTEQDSLESIYTRFNIDHPADFKGHSLSVSDIVVLHQDGKDTAHYCDRFGFSQVPEFLQPERAAEVTIPTPDQMATQERISTPRGSFCVTNMTREQMEAAGYGVHHISDDGKYLIMGNDTRAFAVAAEQPEKDNPLRTAEMTLEDDYGMLNGVSGYENHIEYMERSLAVVDRMEKLVKELLYVSKVEGTQKTEYKTVDFAEILRVQVAAVADLLEEKKQHLEANIPTRLYCEVEQAQMERAIQNILVNAIRYSPSGELIRISLSEMHGTIRGEIENTGVRVPDDAIPHLFEAFYRADTSRNRNTGGTGLGLYIVRKVMEMHRANYGISNINNGVLFWFELPCKQPVDNSI